MLAPFAFYFGIRSWEIDLLTYDEFEIYAAQAKAIMDNAGG